jgi:hypothetical protein
LFTKFQSKCLKGERNQALSDFFSLWLRTSKTGKQNVENKGAKAFQEAGVDSRFFFFPLSLFEVTLGVDPNSRWIRFFTRNSNKIARQHTK